MDRPTPPVTPPIGNGVPFLKRKERRECSYEIGKNWADIPVEEKRCCGAPIAHEVFSYCEYHLAVVLDEKSVRLLAQRRAA